ncbi:uncharacterized protein LOC118187692 [Stegodyphus dumicola]|uniref:uncharacterized protein LOC118187692 n=1 Tax=Stegodyphus dumicola TaxID=202533 RepID=UPI0015AA006E|nr:uncharacterized protein LOC118187692 [Stegodyphus dumicola]
MILMSIHITGITSELRSYFNRKSGGGSVMVETAIGFNRQVGFIFLDGRQNSSKYMETLRDHLMPFAENIKGQNRMYQNDNVPIHTSNITNKYLDMENVTVSEWRPISDDFIQIENVQGTMSRRVCENERQFSSVNSLKAAI